MCGCVHVVVGVGVHASLYSAMFLAGWGRIVNTASGHGLVASVNKSAYIASKHGIVGLTKVSPRLHCCCVLVGLHMLSVAICINCIIAVCGHDVLHFT